MPGGHTNDPSSGYTLLCSSSPCHLPPFQTIEGLFELTRRPSRALDSPHALLLEQQRYEDTARYGSHGRGGPRTHCQKQFTQASIVRL